MASSRGSLTILGVCLAAAVGLTLGPSLGQGSASRDDQSAVLGAQGGQMLLRADQVDYDLNTSVAVAHGHVEIDYNGRILQADRVTYDQNKDVVSADGHVVLMAPTGDVAFATHMVLTDQMRDGTIQSFSALIGPNGRLAAPHGERTNAGTRTTATRGIFTACKICDKPGQRTPLWSVRAAHVLYDQVAHRVYYRDAVVQFFGVPVLYTPYFTQPDPTVRHASGVLMPEIGSHSTLGYFARVPVYIALTDSQDMTVAPMVSTRGGEQMEAEYRQRWDVGGLWFQASVANDPHGGHFGNIDQTYSSLYGSGLVPLSDDWHLGFDAQLTSYASYLARYDISGSDRLTNDLYFEGINGRSRFAITGYFFQGLRITDNNNLFPVVLPLVEYTYVPQSSFLGGQFQFGVNTTATSSHIGENNQRASAELRWRWPLVLANGQLFTLQLDAREDAYHFGNVNFSGPTGFPNDQYLTRGAPYLGLDWRWPFVSPGVWGMSAFIAEPIAQAVWAPYGDNPAQLLHLNDAAANVLNGDSASFELDETNIFDFNRLPGYDLVESGPRATLGGELEALYPTGSIDFLVGQSYRLKPDSVLADVSPLAGAGFGQRSSDIVSRLTVSFLPHFNISDRVDVDPHTGTLDRNEVYVDAQYGRSSVQLAYLRVPPEEELLGLGTREEVKAQALVNVWHNWLVYALGQRDLATGDMIQDEFGVGYQDECFGISLSYLRQFTQFRDVPPSTAVYLRWSLKTSPEPAADTSIFPEHLYAGGAL